MAAVGAFLIGVRARMVRCAARQASASFFPPP